MGKGRRIQLQILLAALLAASGRAAAESAAAPAQVTFLPHWIPQAQFAGYYLAVDQGIYARHGLAVTVLEGGPRRPVEKALPAGEVTFASHFLSAALALRDGGAPLVHLAQLSQRSALLLVARRAQGIRSLRDLDGCKVSVWPSFTLQPEALFREAGLHVRILKQGPTINLFLRGGVDAASAMWYNEYHLLLNAGLNADELTVFRYDDCGLNFPEDGIFTRADTWRTQPDVCRRFVAATLEGWQYAFAHREAALDATLRRADAAGTGTNRAHQRWMLDRMYDLFLPAQPERYGRLQRADYDRVAQAMRTAGLLRAAPAFEEFHVPALP